MLNTRKFQTIGVVVLIVAAALVSLSAIKLPTPAFIPVTGSNLEGLAQYYRSERVLAYPAKSSEAGLTIYHLSERGAPESIKNDLEAYYQSERLLVTNWAHSNDPYFKYHQSEWFGK